MSDTILRHMTMLSLIPGHPVKITAGQLHDKLKAQGFEIHARSIERDLHKLSNTFALLSDEGKPAGWSWRDRKTRMTFPPMNTETALTFELLSRYLAPVLPRSMLTLLEPDFEHARQVLDDLRSAPLGRWSKRIAVLPFGQQLLPPEVKPDVSAVVYDALLQGKRFEADYRSVNADGPKRRVFNPLGLVYREGVLYLVATLWDYPNPLHFALQRMSKAQPLQEAAISPEGFDFERYIRDEKAFDYPVGRDIKLELIVEEWLARHLEESRLSAEQQISPIRGRNEFRVTAHVADTDQLFWWLRSLGPSVEVTKPAALRRKMTEQMRELQRMYG